MGNTSRVAVLNRDSCYYKKLIGHFNHTVVTVCLLGYQRLIA